MKTVFSTLGRTVEFLIDSTTTFIILGGAILWIYF